MKVQQLNGNHYRPITVQTSFGTTRVWGYNMHLKTAKVIVFFPGARTCGLFWDMDNALMPFKDDYQYYIVDVNGQPGLSEGHCPNQKTDEYGIWATEVLNALSISKAIIAGASLGGLICMKLCLTSPALVEKAILINPAGIRAFSVLPANLYYNLLPIIAPTERNLDRFLNNAVFCPPHHAVPSAYRELINEYLLYALRNHTFRGDYPAPLRRDELSRLTTDIYLILGDKDTLFPYRGTMKVAEKYIHSLKEIRVLPNTAHGIETSKEAIGYMRDIVEQKRAPVSPARLVWA